MRSPRLAFAVGLSVLVGCASSGPSPFAVGEIDPSAECRIQLVNRNAQGVQVRMLDSSGTRDIGYIVPDDRRTVTAFCKDRRVGITAVADGRSGTSLGYHRCVSLDPNNVVRVVMSPLTPRAAARVCRPEGTGDFSDSTTPAVDL